MWRLASLVCVAAALAATPAAQERGQGASLPAGQAADLVRTRCVTCHGPDLIAEQRLSRDGWVREVDKMIGWGASLPEPEKTQVVDYLALHFGRRTAAAGGGAAGDDGAAGLLATRCLGCHDAALVEQQRLTRAGWVRELDKMIGWGAVLTPAERDTLAAHLAGRYTP